MNAGNALCTLCEELDGGDNSLYHQLDSELPPSRVLEVLGDWLVLPTVGPLTRGHLMLVSANHITSTLQPGSGRHALEDAVTTVATKLRSLYGDSIIAFEHGAAKRLAAHCGGCVDHAHLHLLPGPVEVLTAAIGRLQNWRFEHRAPLLTRSEGELGYLLVARPLECEWWIRECDSPLPSQYMRQLYATVTGTVATWDWRVHPLPRVMIETIEDWKS